MDSDLISRYALVKDLEKVFCDNCDNYNEIRCRACLMDDALGYIDAQPTVDAVEVVRCKDCKFNVANMKKDPLDATDYSDITCSYFMTDGMEVDDFCSYGAKMDGGD